MPEPPTLIMIASSAALALPLVHWYIGHPRCKSCGTRVKRVSEQNGIVVAECPNGCHVTGGGIPPVE